jgi:uncharacterized membrane protein YedE/YeeE
MKAHGTSFIAGIIFALGLGLSGMTRPIKVIGFLDFFGNWDPSLACVMIAAIGVFFVAYRISQKMSSPMLAEKFTLPRRADLDGRLILGSAIFGAGWGLGGFCPGPAITSLASGATPVVIFVVTMAIGIYLHGWIFESARSHSRAPVLASQPVADS